jgi:hypothetical protein
VEPKGIEPSTSALRTQEPSDRNVAATEVTATPSTACTPACTGEEKPDPTLPVEDLASAILRLSAADRARLVALILTAAR